MQVSPARKAAFEILLRVEAGRGFATDMLQTAEISALSEADRRLATEITMGVLRRRGEIDFLLEQLSGKSIMSFDREVATALRMGLYQMAFLERIPKSAAVNEAVELTKLARKRSAASLVNAVLRKFQGSREGARQDRHGVASGEDQMLARRSAPQWLLERWEKNYGPAAAGAIAWASTRVPPVILRVPESVGSVADVLKVLAEKRIGVRPGQYASRGLIVEAGERMPPKVAEEMGLAIQDEASQLVAELLAVHPGQRVLDLCAAPGMKTAQLADALEGGLLVACDISARRLMTMARLLPRLTGKANHVAMVRLDATGPLPFNTAFDRILLDAPCSGTGTLARNPEIKWRLAPQDLERLSTTQANLLHDALGLLAPGGRLVYATCSLEPEENERVVEGVLPGYRLLPRTELLREFPKLDVFINADGYFHTRPDLHGMDGFFAAVIVREPE